MPFDGIPPRASTDASHISAMMPTERATVGSPIGLQLPVGPADSVMLNPKYVFPNNRDWISKEFTKHAKKWEKDTKYISSPFEKYLHPSYARIIGLGHLALPLILRRLQTHPSDWFYALRAIAGIELITNDIAGDFKKMSEAWITWGIQQQHI